MIRGWRLNPNWVHLHREKISHIEGMAIHQSMLDNQRRIADDNAALIKIQRDHLDEHRSGKRPAEDIGSGETKQ